NHEQREHLTLQILQAIAEGREAEVDGIEHDLDRDEHQDDVASPEKADQANGEKDRAQPQASARRDHSGLAFLRATTIAPTMAARRISEAISNGSPNRVKSAMPTA